MVLSCKPKENREKKREQAEVTPIISPEYLCRSWQDLRHWSGNAFTDVSHAIIFAFQFTKTINNEKVSIDFFEHPDLILFGFCSENIRCGKR